MKKNEFLNIEIFDKKDLDFHLNHKQRVSILRPQSSRGGGEYPNVSGPTTNKIEQLNSQIDRQIDRYIDRYIWLDISIYSSIARSL